jgi:hypothetical protein
MSKTKIKFNIMDALILFAILAVAAVLLYVFVFSETDDSLTSAGDACTLTYVVEVTGISEEFADKIAPGDAVTDSSKKLGIGTVSAVEQHPYQYLGENLTDASLVLTSVDDYCNLYVTVQADATLSGIGYSIGGYDIYVGAKVHMSFADLVCTGYCISLDAAQ